MSELAAIDEFLRVYNQATSSSYTITRCPDKVNRATRDIDALAEAEGRESLAIEHTLVETVDSQKRDDAQYTEAFLELSNELASVMPQGMRVVLPHGVLRLGEDWGAIRRALGTWLRNHTDPFPVGCSEHNVPGVPLPVDVWRPRVTAGVPFGIFRMATDSGEVGAMTVSCVSRSLRDKDEQLRPYFESGAVTILVLESQDWILTSEVALHDAFLDARRAVPAPHVRQVWLARFATPGAKWGILCFDGPQEIMDAVNPPNLGWRSRGT